jgi:hypothetical protein
MIWAKLPRPAIRWMFSTAIIVTIWLGAITMPAALIGPGIEESWQHGLYHLHQQHLQAGRDYFFTYGPLGHFLAVIYEPGFFPYKFAWELAAKLLFAVAAFAAIQGLPGRFGKFLLAAALIGLAPYMLLDFTYVMTILFLGVYLIRATRVCMPAVIGILIALAAFSLAKFTLLLMSVAAVSCLSMRLLAEQPRWRGMLPGTVYLLAVLTLWLLAGQQPSNFLGFLRGSMEVSGGYTEAMAIYGRRIEVAIGLTALLCCGGAVVTMLPRLLHNPRDLAALILIVVITFLQWKHGFVRHDLHAILFFCYMVLTALAFPGFFAEYDWSRAPRAILVGYAVPLSAVGIWLAGNLPVQPRKFLSEVNHHYCDRVSCVRSLRKFAAAQDALTAAQAATCRLPQVAAEVGQASVDLIGHEQGVLFANRFNWHPRPMFQSYAAYTPALLRLNASFFGQAQSPEYVLFKLQSMDGRLPVLEDGLATIEILKRYEPVLTEASYVLFKRRIQAESFFGPSPTVKKHVFRLGEEVPINSGTNCIKATLHLEYTKLGKVRNFLFKPPGVQVRFKTDDGRSQNYRIVPSMAEAGFLLNPFLQNENDVIGLYTRMPAKRVVSLCVTPDNHAPWALRQTVRMTLETMPELVTHDLSTAALNRLRYPMMPSPPTGVRSTGPVEALNCAGTSVLLVHPDGQMTFRIPPGARHAVGRFGILPAAYEQHTTDGVQFSVEVIPDHGNAQVLFARCLDPRAQPADRGIQDFVVPIPSGCGGRLICKTSNLPGKNADYDWAFWTGLKID